MTAAWAQSHRVILREAAGFERRRRAFELTGGHQLGGDVSTGYHIRAGRDTPHQVLRADDVDEPDSDRVVPMLDVLPPTDRELYSHEENIIDWKR